MLFRFQLYTRGNPYAFGWLVQVAVALRIIRWKRETNLLIKGGTCRTPSPAVSSTVTLRLCSVITEQYDTEPSIISCFRGVLLSPPRCSIVSAVLDAAVCRSIYLPFLFILVCCYSCFGVFYVYSSCLDIGENTLTHVSLSCGYCESGMIPAIFFEKLRSSGSSDKKWLRYTELFQSLSLDMAIPCATSLGLPSLPPDTLQFFEHANASRWRSAGTATHASIGTTPVLHYILNCVEYTVVEIIQVACVRWSEINTGGEVEKCIAPHMNVLVWGLKIFLPETWADKTWQY